MANYKIPIDLFINCLIDMNKLGASPKIMVEYVRKHSKNLTEKTLTKEEKKSLKNFFK